MCSDCGGCEATATCTGGGVAAGVWFATLEKTADAINLSKKTRSSVAHAVYRTCSA